MVSIVLITKKHIKFLLFISSLKESILNQLLWSHTKRAPQCFTLIFFSPDTSLLRYLLKSD